MSDKGVSRNDPCPCGSGRKYKSCCINKGPLARPPAGPARLLPAAPRPRAASPQGFASLGPFGVVDTRLKEIARAAPGEAGWRTLVEGLTDATSEAERIAAYRAAGEAGVLPADAVLFLCGHAIQWMPSGEGDPDRHVAAALRRHGLDGQADLHERGRLEYDRRHERGRQFFFGPPDQELAARLREKGIID